MKKNTLVRYVQALVLLPIITTSTPALPAKQNVDEGIKVVLKQTIELPSMFSSTNEEADPEAEVRKLKAAAIDQYFKDRDMPLYGNGMTMVLEAEKNDLDWRLIPAIAVRESTGGKFECKKADYNAFGWGSCKINFKSDAHAIETVARNLGGNNPKTARHYADKNVKEILQAYNPPSVVPRYAEQVMNIMNVIGPEQITITNTLAKS